jgi:regulator of sigma E protease
MITGFLYIIFASLGLGLLVFIHELGHYFMARRVGMKVEEFGIGFSLGKPIYSWMHDGVKWQLGWIPFGGFVKIAGMENEKDKDPYAIPGGFFTKSPWDRIKVALAGPIVNILFAFLCFLAIWATGGRQKDFSEFTHVIGWVDPHSELYTKGVRPGDIISSYDNHDYRGIADNVTAPMTSSGNLLVKGFNVNYATGEKTPFEYSVKPYHPVNFKKDFLSSGIISPANYLIYNPSNDEQAFVEGSPMATSDIKPGDRIVWVDGLPVFSLQQLHNVLNDERVLLTIQRNGKILQARVPRVHVEELRLDPEIKDEITDWQHEANLLATKTPKLFTIPYSMNSDNVIDSQLKFIDKENQNDAFPEIPFSPINLTLEKGDKIIAVDGTPVKSAYQLLTQLQERKVNIIVENIQPDTKTHPSTEADNQFEKEFNTAALQNITKTIGTTTLVKKSEQYRLLNPVIPKTRSEFATTPEKQAQEAANLAEEKKKIDAITDPEEKAQALHLLSMYENQLIIGLIPHDLKVNYNPGPVQMFTDATTEIWRTLTALFEGNLNLKWMSGPIGIVQVVQKSWQLGFRDVLFWMGFISLNLGVLNLLPIPVLDGGYIIIFLGELITGKRMQPKTLEKLIIPFVLLIGAFLIYTTYNDITRIFNQFFSW